MKYIIVILFVIVFIPLITFAQEDNKKIHWGSMVQMHFSYAQSDSAISPYGFRLRRLDFRVWNQLTDFFDWSILVGFNYFKFQILEVDGNFTINEKVRFRVGQFAPPAMRSGAPVDHMFNVPNMTFIERAPITLYWSSRSGLYAYRTMGAQIHGEILDKKFYYAFMIGNPIGNNFFRASSIKTIQEHEFNGWSYWGRLEYKIKNNFVSGVFANTANYYQDSIMTDKYSYGAHVLFNGKRLNFMTEFVYGMVRTDYQQTVKYYGFFIEGAYRIGVWEPAFRFDLLNPNQNQFDAYQVNQYNNYTLGLNIYPHEKIKIQLNYIFKKENMSNHLDSYHNNLFYINFQYMLK